MMASLLLCSLALAGEPYVAMNPLALLSFVPSKPVNIAAPLFSDMEFGLAVSGGTVLDRRHVLEGRVALGSPRSLTFSFLPQAQVGYAYVFRDPGEGPLHGPYGGANLRLWDLIYWTSGYGNWSLMPALQLGWWLQVEPLFVKVHVDQILGACSWSTQPGTTGACAAFLSPAPAMAPVLPLFGADVGVGF